MSGGTECRCAPKDRTKWHVLQYMCNHSAFNGYRHTPSSYSSVRCTECRMVWRTKARYVHDLPREAKNDPQ